MSRIGTHVVYLAVIALLTIALGISLRRPSKVVEVVKREVDTLSITRYDTLKITTVKEVEKRVVDTVYISNGLIPISQYRFFEQNKYDITAFGYGVLLESVTVFPKTITNTITNTIEKEILVTNWDIYLGGGLWKYKDEWIPRVSATVKSPKNFLFGADLGFPKEGLMIGGTVQYKITHNR